MVADLPSLTFANGKQFTAKEVLHDFGAQCEPYKSCLEREQLIQRKALRVHFSSEDIMKDTCASLREKVLKIKIKIKIKILHIDLKPFNILIDTE